MIAIDEIRTRINNLYGELLKTKLELMEAKNGKAGNGAKSKTAR